MPQVSPLLQHIKNLAEWAWAANIKSFNAFGTSEQKPKTTFAFNVIFTGRVTKCVFLFILFIEAKKPINYINVQFNKIFSQYQTLSKLITAVRQHHYQPIRRIWNNCSLKRQSLCSVRRPIGDNMLVSEIVSISHLFCLHYSVYINCAKELKPKCFASSS